MPENKNEKKELKDLIPSDSVIKEMSSPTTYPNEAYRKFMTAMVDMELVLSRMNRDNDTQNNISQTHLNITKYNKRRQHWYKMLYQLLCSVYPHNMSDFDDLHKYQVEGLLQSIFMLKHVSSADDVVDEMAIQEVTEFAVAQLRMAFNITEDAMNVTKRYVDSVVR